MDTAINCDCRRHTLYTYVVSFKDSSFIPESLKRYENREYTGVHSCRNRNSCSGNFSDRHYLGSSSHKAYREIKKLFPEALILTREETFDSCDALDLAEERIVDYNYVLRSDTFNRALGGSRRENPALKVCIFCDGSAISHKKECSLFRPASSCKECGGRHGHFKSCSNYNAAPDCLECSGISGNHYKVCSSFTKAIPCIECQVEFGHLKICSKFKLGAACELCNGLDGKHRKQCLRFKPKDPCLECGSRGTSHLKHCLLYKTPKNCSECNSPSGKHKKICARYVKPRICSECSVSKSHKKTCSLYKAKNPCSICGSLNNGSHRKNCSKYKKKTGCLECGYLAQHKESCSKYIANDCKDCGGQKGKHKKTCLLKK